MTTIYRFKIVSTKGGIATSASPLPTIDIINVAADSKLVTSASVITKTSLAGYCEYNYTGADDLDLVGLFHTTDTSTDQQDLISYIPDIFYVNLDANVGSRASGSLLALIPTNTSSASAVDQIYTSMATVSDVSIASASAVLDMSLATHTVAGTAGSKLAVLSTASSVALIPTNTASASSVASIPTNPLLTNDARLNNIDTTISSRMSGSYLDSLASASSVANITGTSASTIWEYVDRKLTSASNLDLSSASSVAAIPTNPFLTNDARIPAMIASASSVEAITSISASTIWAYGVRELTGGIVSASSISNEVWNALVRTLTDNTVEVPYYPYISTTPITLYTYSGNVVSVPSVPDDAEIWLTIKRAYNTPDSDAILMVGKTEGLMYYNGMSGSSISGSATLVVSGGNAIGTIDASVAPILSGVTSISAYGEIKTKTSASIVSIITQFPVVISHAVARQI